MLCRDEEYMLLLDIVEILSQHERVAVHCGLGCGVVGPFIFCCFALVVIVISFPAS